MPLFEILRMVVGAHSADQVLRLGALSLRLLMRQARLNGGRERAIAAMGDQLRCSQLGRGIGQRRLPRFVRTTKCTSVRRSGHPSCER